MKTNPDIQRQRRGFAMILVVIFAAASLVVLSGVMSGTANTSRFTDRNNTFLFTSGAAEAAAEKVIGNMVQDYADLGETNVYANLGTYRATIPTTSESDLWSGFQFSDSTGSKNVTGVSRLTNWAFGDLPGRYKSLKANFATYRVTAASRPLSGMRTNSMTIAQTDLQFASIPIFQYQYFYALDLEMCPSANFDVSGRIHSNRSIYLEPDTSTLNLQSDVTAAYTINHSNSPNDPQYRQLGTINYSGEHDSRSHILKLPLGTTNSSDNLHELIEIPPLGESATSLLGQQRFYNKADLVILVNNNSVTATSGSFNGFATTVAWSTVNTFLNTNVYFFDKREGREVRVTELDVKQLTAKAATLKTLFSNRDVKIVYIADLSNTDTNSMPGVRVINGATLPTTGLTVATPHPIYVLGHYNTSAVNTGTTNTTKAYPAALAGDAVTLLSSRWSDSWSYLDFSVRNAANTTVNAAFITGIVPSGGGYYSGGVENSLRLLEDWSSRTLTFNGAIAVLFESQTATSPWGATADVYTPATRKWAWDQNFATYSKLPPGTPELRTVLRTQFVTTQAAAN